jgi:hypothetical protein
MLGCAHQPQTSETTTVSPHPGSEKTQEPVGVTETPEEQAAETVHKIDEFLGLVSAEDLAPPAKELAAVPRVSPAQTSSDDRQIEPVTEPTPVVFQAQVIPPIDAPHIRDTAPKGVGLNFDNADIYDVTRVVSEITGKSFILDKDVQGTVTIFSESTLTPDEVFALFKTVLELNGLAIRQVGDFL